MQTIDHIVYCCFDRFPSPKGAATHVAQFVSALGNQFGSVDLVTLPSGYLPDHSGDNPHSQWSSSGVSHFQLKATGSNLIDRVAQFRRNQLRWWKEQYFNRNQRPRVVHFRSIFEGYPIAREKKLFCESLVFEVNGLPSIELKYHYPKVAGDEEFLNKIRQQEQACLDAADLIITVSEVTRRHLIFHGVPEQKIHTIPNGVDLKIFSNDRPALRSADEIRSELKVIYTGTTSPWQGVQHAIEAIALYRRDAEATLRLVGPSRKKEQNAIESLIRKLKLEDYVSLEPAVSKQQLNRMYHQADVMLAPLTRCDRNTNQGCCPLKILEAMAAGIPVVSSRLAVVEELIDDGINGMLVRPNSGKAIKDALQQLVDQADCRHAMVTAARKKIEQMYCWSNATSKLIELYESTLFGRNSETR